MGEWADYWAEESREDDIFEDESEPNQILLQFTSCPVCGTRVATLFPASEHPVSDCSEHSR